jgi:hypothetical protein
VAKRPAIRWPRGHAIYPAELGCNDANRTQETIPSEPTFRCPGGRRPIPPGAPTKSPTKWSRLQRSAETDETRATRTCRSGPLMRLAETHETTAMPLPRWGSRVRVSASTPGTPKVRAGASRPNHGRTGRAFLGLWTNVDNIRYVQQCLAVSGASSVSAGPGLSHNPEDAGSDPAPATRRGVAARRPLGLSTSGNACVAADASP